MTKGVGKSNQNKARYHGEGFLREWERVKEGREEKREEGCK